MHVRFVNRRHRTLFAARPDLTRGSICGPRVRECFRMPNPTF